MHGHLGLDGNATNGPLVVFADHHQEIDEECTALRAWASTDDPSEFVNRYRRFERAILAHISAEEDVILPAYARFAPDDAAAILASHQEIRGQLFRLGVEAELHCVRREALDMLLATLREHVRNENAGMYPWAAANLPPPLSHTVMSAVRERLSALSSRRASRR